MKVFYVLFSLFVLVILTGCKKEAHNLNQEFSLDFGKKAFVEIDGTRHKIEFIEVEDSRCPPGANCFRMGEVAVKIRIDKTDLILGQHTTIPSSAVYLDHEVSLRKVSYDSDKHWGEDKCCSVRLIIK